MISGTSTVPTPTRLGVASTPALSFPTVFSNVHPLQALAADQTLESSSCPNKVVIHLSTAVVLPNYSLFYNDPISLFQPKYQALDDGSLITPPFMEDLAGSNLSLLVTGFIAMVFVRNIIVSGDYLRRGKVKNKTLFYILFLSQLLGPVSIAPILVSYFDQALDCTVYVVLSQITTVLSHRLFSVILLSWIAGTISLALLVIGSYKHPRRKKLILLFRSLVFLG